MSTSISTQPIKRRTVLYTKYNDIIIFPGWAVAVTSLGTAFEPFLIDGIRTPNISTLDVDHSDPMCRIDGLQGMDEVAMDVVLYDSGTPLHGGTLVPRDFGKAGEFVR